MVETSVWIWIVRVSLSMIIINTAYFLMRFVAHLFELKKTKELEKE